MVNHITISKTREPSAASPTMASMEITAHGTEASGLVISSTQRIVNLLNMYNTSTEAYYNVDPTGFDPPSPVSPQITIVNEDTRAITGLRVTADFTINGQPYTDYEDIGPFDRFYGLVLNGENGTWNGTKWVGNFLKTQYSGFSTQINPGLLTFLNVLFYICYVVDAVAAAIAAGNAIKRGRNELPGHGGTWSLGQLI